MPLLNRAILSAATGHAMLAAASSKICASAGSSVSAVSAIWQRFSLTGAFRSSSIYSLSSMISFRSIRKCRHACLIRHLSGYLGLRCLGDIETFFCGIVFGQIAFNYASPINVSFAFDFIKSEKHSISDVEMNFVI
jgi:hypothetical protein